MRTVALGLAALMSLGITSSVYALPMAQDASSCADRSTKSQLRCETCYLDENGAEICVNCVKIGELPDGTTIW